MFGIKSKRQKRKEQKANVKLAKKILQTDSGRPVFGFKCVPHVKADMMQLSGQLNVPLYALSEHALELGLIQIKEAVNDAKEREELIAHLSDVHIADRTEEKVAQYDKDAAEDLSIERLRRFEREAAVRKIVYKFRLFPPAEIERLLVLGYRTQVAMARNRQPLSPKPGSVESS